MTGERGLAPTVCQQEPAVKPARWTPHLAMALPGELSQRPVSSRASNRKLRPLRPAADSRACATAPSGCARQNRRARRPAVPAGDRRAPPGGLAPAVAAALFVSRGQIEHQPEQQVIAGAGNGPQCLLIAQAALQAGNKRSIASSFHAQLILGDGGSGRGSSRRRHLRSFRSSYSALIRASKKVVVGSQTSPRNRPSRARDSLMGVPS